MLIEIIGEWAIVLVREDHRFFCLGRLSALNLFLSTKGDRFLEMAMAMHFPFISIPVKPEWWSVGSRESGVGECGIIDLDFIIPMQPETISLYDLVDYKKLRYASA